MSLKLEIVEEQPPMQSLTKTQEKKAKTAARAATAAVAEEKSKASADVPSSIKEQINVLISAISRQIEEISILIAEKQSIDDGLKIQLQELLDQQQSNQQELNVFKEKLSQEKNKLSNNKKILSLLNGESENDSVGGADIVRPSTAMSAKMQEPSSAPKAPTLAQKAAAAAALPTPVPTKAPSVAPALKGKQAAASSVASSAVQLVKITPFQTVKKGKTGKNDFLTIVMAMCQLLEVDTACVQTFVQEVTGILINCLSIEDYPFREVPCTRGGCKLAKHDAFKEKVSHVFYEKSEETLSIFQMAVENLMIAGVNGNFDDGRFRADEDLRADALALIEQYYQTIQ
jgi:hypothetical protein